jgi:hypothetical protein
MWLFGRVFLVLLLGSICQRVALSQPMLIVPGQSIGKVHVGQPEPKVRGRAGIGKALQPHWEDWVMTPRAGRASMLEAYAVPDSKTHKLVVRALRIVSSDYATAAHLSTASRFAQIRRTFPALRLIGSYENQWLGPVGIYDAVAAGIAFEMLLDRRTRQPQRCLCISIHMRGVPVVNAYRLHPNLRKSFRVTKSRG